MAQPNTDNVYTYTEYKATPSRDRWRVLGITAQGRQDVLATRDTAQEAKELAASLTRTRQQLLDILLRHFQTDDTRNIHPDDLSPVNPR